MTLRERAAAIATIAHPDRRETNGFVKSYSYDMLYLAVHEERKRCAELVVRESPTLGQQLAAKIHETGDL